MALTLEHLRETVGQRFHQPTAPTLITLQKPQRTPIVVSYVESRSAMTSPTLAPPVEDGLAVHVHHGPLRDTDTWIDGRHALLPFVPTGGICIWDLTTSPVAFVHEEFAFSRFYLARSTLEELAHEHDLARVGPLRLPPLGHRDPVLEHLALALRARAFLQGAPEVDSLFADWVALAFHAHVVGTYGEKRAVLPRVGGLSAHRLRFVTGWMEERLGEPLSIAAIAAQVDMAPGHFARAFRASTGHPPHRWLVDRRIARAKTLLAAGLVPIADIARACGFADQSHLTRVFSRREQATPASFRRRRRAGRA